MKSALVFLMVVVPVVSIFGAERITDAEMQYNREYNTAKDEFDKKVKVAKDKLIISLKNEMKKLMTTANLDEAIKIKEKITSLESSSFIVSARYGLGDVWVDVTENIRKLTTNNNLNVTNDGWGVPDPIPGKRKITVIEYHSNNSTKINVSLYGDKINIRL